MVLPIVRSVKLSAGKPITIDRTLRADGQPRPPFPPQTALTLVADGQPRPPFPPQFAQTPIADGQPRPPFPPQFAQTALSAYDFSNLSSDLNRLCHADTLGLSRRVHLC